MRAQLPAASGVQHVTDDRIFDAEQRQRAVADHIDKYRHDFFFLKSDDFETEAEYRVVIKTDDESPAGYTTDERGFAYVGYGDALIAVVLGWHFPKWQRAGAGELCDGAGAKVLRTRWERGTPGLLKYPTDSGLASAGVRTLARDGRKLAKLVGETKARVRDRSRSMGRKLRAISRTIRRRCGEAKVEVLKLTAQTGGMLECSVKEAQSLAAVARRKARGRGVKVRLKAAVAVEELADRCEKIASQIRQRVLGKPIRDRLVLLFDPDARPIPKGKLGKPNPGQT
jgi:hypothetical protein